ncbi:MAG: Stp1/IreP family PP2C-type Ser/Thr phosphatase [Clostridiales bacterium]|nr:Stp1/IreP family PP2C-type Ser/Thr phosphatase [Clostridiales bacterium]
MIAVGISDRGKVRETNEDRYLIYHDGPICLFAVADGMGGHAGGEVASTLALETVKTYLVQNGTSLLEKIDAGRNMTSLLEEMLLQANKKVLDTASVDTELVGMGTTLTMLLAAKDHFWLGHIGDSRAYLINREGIFHLTEDHTLVTQLMRCGQISEEESNGHPQRHFLTRALGTDEDSVFDIIPQSFWPGDVVLLCTDGLHGFIENNEIRDVVLGGGEPENVLERLVRLANERGGKDNITAVLVTF